MLKQNCIREALVDRGAACLKNKNIWSISVDIQEHAAPSLENVIN